MPDKTHYGSRSGNRATNVRLRLSEAEKEFLASECNKRRITVSLAIRASLALMGLLPKGSVGKEEVDLLRMAA